LKPEGLGKKCKSGEKKRKLSSTMEEEQSSEERIPRALEVYYFPRLGSADTVERVAKP
jgi:hypothetical protein